MDFLLNNTYEQIVAAAEGVERANYDLEILASHLSCAVETTLLVVRIKCELSEK